jgi:hypothetical protein
VVEVGSLPSDLTEGKITSAKASLVKQLINSMKALHVGMYDDNMCLGIALMGMEVLFYKRVPTNNMDGSLGYKWDYVRGPSPKPGVKGNVWFSLYGTEWLREMDLLRESF